MGDVWVAARVNTTESDWILLRGCIWEIQLGNVRGSECGFPGVLLRANTAERISVYVGVWL
jgi:hypothetical protein